MRISNQQHFLDSHKEIDEGLKHEKSRIVKIRRIFIIVDALMAFGVIPGILWAGFSLNYPIIAILGTLNIEAAFLAYFSFRIGKIMQNMTGYAPNMRFITVHIVNLVLLCIATASQAILNIKT